MPLLDWSLAGIGDSGDRDARLVRAGLHAAVLDQMHAAAEEWLSAHRDHLPDVVEIEAPCSIEWPVTEHVLQHLHCNRCRVEHTFKVVTG